MLGKFAMAAISSLEFCTHPYLHCSADTPFIFRQSTLLAFQQLGMDSDRGYAILDCPEQTHTSPNIMFAKVIVVPVLESVAVILYLVNPPWVGGSFAIHVEFSTQTLSAVWIVLP
jgi:hypothetical protein